jgi:glycosyltransferase involved in cell wall biosynthesis
MLLNGSSHHIVGSRDAEDMLLKYGIGRNSMSIVPPSTDLAQIAAYCERRRLGDHPDEALDSRRRSSSFVILFVGRLVRSKGLLDLLKAYSILENRINGMQLIVVGRGPLKHTIEAFAMDGRQDRVKLIDNLEGSDLLDVYMEASVLVLPSYSERYGIVALEAFAAGASVAVSSACGTSQSLPPSPWVGVFSPGDPEHLAEVVLCLGRNDAKSDHVLHSSLIRKVVAEHSYELLTARILEVIEKVQSPDAKDHARN